MKINSLDDSGQLILVTGIVIAVIVIGGITVLNLSSFTDVQKSSQGDDKTAEAYTELVALESNVESAIRVSNHDPDEQTSLTNLRDYTSQLDKQKETISMRNGEYVRLTNVGDINMGHRVWRPSYGQLNTSNGNINDSVLKTSGGKTSTLGIKVKSVTNTVDVVVGGERLELTEESDGNITVSSANTGESCEASEETKPVSITVFDGTVNNVDCEAISNTLDSTSRIEIEDGHNITASLNMITAESSYSGNARDNGGSPSKSGRFDSTDGLEVHDAIYSAEGDVTINTMHTTVETRLTFIPHINQGE